MRGRQSKSRSKVFQRELRNNPTDAEKAMWYALRGRQIAGLKFRRQHPFCGYVLDFVCLEIGLVIEIDGSQHEDQSRHDASRTQFLEKAGFRVLRFWNSEVLGHIEAVKEKICDVACGLEPHPHPDPPLEGEGD